MIVFDLICGNDHRFESWFANSDAFEKLKKAGEVACPVCGDAHVEKALMAPAVSGTKKKADEKAAMHAGEYISAIRELRAQVEQNCDYVGEKFPEEARRIHYGESEQRGIYGNASVEETKDLLDEGIEVFSIPVPRRTDS